MEKLHRYASCSVSKLRGVVVRILIAITTILLLTSCSALENYKFGDATRTALNVASKIIKLKQDYCSEQNEASKELILLSIRAIDPDYTGVCDD